MNLNLSKEEQDELRFGDLTPKEPGWCEGDTCNRDGCDGVIETHPPDNCSCHMGMPPCSACTDPRFYCPKCDWEEADE
jgi:hypothetical protein